ncbi:MAG: glycosyl hydrolase family 88 [Epulopiscium sp.]|jgi:unsaturated rhamnogalacturonyl hydrolase|nr:glycosyl hydrolase family 88 [Candidatus Epulonipiscium sp.]
MKFKEYFDQYLRDFDNSSRPVWNYEDGIVLLGAQYLYEATKEPFYKQVIINFMERYIDEDGNIRYYDPTEYNVDKLTNGRALFFLYRETKNEKYKKALDVLMNQIKSHPRTSFGSFWHKKIYPYQVWLDGLYMAMPLYLEYETLFNNKENYNDIIAQFKHCRQYLFNEEKKLYYHAYDEKKVQIWADKETGLSPNFWLRSVGWLLMALVDCCDIISEEAFEHYKTLEGMFKEAIKGILLYQDKETKLFYQLIDLPDVEGNYLETSGSAMVAYSILKGCRLGILQEEKYREIGEGILEGLEKEKLKMVNGKLELTDMCEVAGLGPKDERDGSVEYYLSEPIVSDEKKGVGAAMMAYSEYLKLKALDIK